MEVFFEVEVGKRRMRTNVELFFCFCEEKEESVKEK